MKRLLRSILSGALLVTLISSCSTVRIDAPDFEFPTKATREAGRDKTGNYEDYTFRDTRVRFYSADTPSDLQSWDGFGTDGGHPWEILTGVSIKSVFGDYELPATLVSDLGNPNIRQSVGYDHVRIDQEASVLRIAMSNSDGAGSYRVLFVIDLQGGRAQRHVRDYLEPEFTRTHDWTPLNRKGEQDASGNRR
jgi:hypothetical protein